MENHLIYRVDFSLRFNCLYNFPCRKSFNMPTSPPSPQRPSLLKSSFVSAQKQHAQTAVISQGDTTEIYRSDTLIQVITSDPYLWKWKHFYKTLSVVV